MEICQTTKASPIWVRIGEYSKVEFPTLSTVLTSGGVSRGKTLRLFGAVGAVGAAGAAGYVGAPG